MSILLDEHVATLNGNCSVEEAEPLYEWLLRHPSGEVVLHNLKHMHTAVLQVLVMAKPPVRFSGDVSVFIATWIKPLFATGE